MQLWNGIYQTIVAFGLEGVFARLPSRTVVYFVYAPSAVRPSRAKRLRDAVNCVPPVRLDGQLRTESAVHMGGSRYGRVALLRDRIE